jgi:quinoprotein glucose dehydrogenase
MKSRIVLVGIAALFVAGAFYSLSAQSSRSIWDGVYTQDQANRGRAAYTENCSACHGAELAGGDETPPLTGGEFLANWNGLSVDDLFERMRVSMPADKPGKLSRQTNADILSYILSFNKFPTGSAELPTQAEILKQVRFLAQKP